MMKEGSFREDLYYRLNVVSIWIPPLRRRKADIPSLVDHFIHKYSAENNKDVQGITREAMDRIIKHNFPGNVRELENMIERAVVFTRGELITLGDLPAPIDIVAEKETIDPDNLEDGYEEKMQTFERRMITEALAQTDGNQSAAARLLGITERHIRSRMERLDMK